MPTTRITFTGHSGDQLAARLDMPEGPHLATALFAHCFTCSKDIPAARRIARRLAALGIAVLRFDFTTTFSTNVDDLKAASAYLASQGMAPSLLIGHSLGGAAVLKLAPDLPGIKAVATLGAPYDPDHVTHNFGGALEEIAANGEASVLLGGRKITIGKGFVEDVNAASLTGASNCPRPPRPSARRKASCACARPTRAAFCRTSTRDRTITRWRTSLWPTGAPIAACHPMDTSPQRSVPAHP